MSKYALSLAKDSRILYATFEKFSTVGSVLVDSLPDGNIADYLYQNGEFVYDPIPEPETVETPSQRDRIEAQVTYTAMMTDTLLEE